MVVEQVEVAAAATATSDQHDIAKRQDQGLTSRDIGDGVDEGDDVGDRFDHARIDVAKESGNIEQRHRLAGQVADDRDGRGEDIDEGLERIGDFLDSLDQWPQEIGEEGAQIKTDIFESDVIEVEGAVVVGIAGAAELHGGH